ncbi:LLM class flavin-dependent oxidoreductase [Pseudonocardia ailaonensis]|uniref:LLM class flavin-dependent oxidoreductase n=1 Tax=Pseudonocardia ailaonensis TaxID=367279 RepID=A0ABN2NA74_9PSEU
MTQTPSTSQMHLVASLHQYGHHAAAWRHPAATLRNADIDYYVECARIAEDATFDALYLTDEPSLRQNVGHYPHAVFEPITLLSALASVTRHIGLIAPMAATYFEPYNLARQLSSLDHISSGRAAWNMVTVGGDAVASNFGHDRHPDAAERYERAQEVLEAVLALWESWAPDAVVADPAGPTYADEGKIAVVHQSGTHIRLEGRFTAPRSPQGHPVVIQEGAYHPIGRPLAAARAETILVAFDDREAVREYGREMKERAALAGRDPELLKIITGILPVIAESTSHAAELAAELDELSLTEIELKATQDRLDVDLSDLGPTDLVPADRFAGRGGRADVVAGMIARERPTLVQLLNRISAGTHGRKYVIGTAAEIADLMEDWFRSGAVDGFNVMAPVLPSGLRVFTEQVVPLLRARGLFRTGYSGTTLRDHLGLPTP